MTNQNKITFEERQIRRRNRKVNSLRFNQGIKELFFKKNKLIMFLLFIIAIVLVWFLLVYKPSNNLDVFRQLIYIAFWLFISVCIWGIITWFGKPKNAQKIEDDMKDILNIKEDHKVPILKSITKNEDKTSTYEFYSPDLTKDKCEEKRSDIEQKLGIKILGKIKSNGKFIYFNAISQKYIKLRGELTDDEI